MTKHIATSPLTGRISQGRVNKAGDAFIGEKTDVTSQVLQAVLEKAAFHGGKFDIEGGGRKWLVTVTEQVAQALPLEEQPKMTREQWNTAYAALMVERTGMIYADALSLADSADDCFNDDESPSDAVHEEISNWMD